MISSREYRAKLVLAMAFLCLGVLVPAAGAAEFKYTLDPELSLTGDCSTSTADPVPDPDCEPAYPAPPDGPSGRFDRPFALAVDDWGNQYVASRSGDGTKGRIDVFNSEGRFITELDDPFGPQSIAVDGEGNLYAYEALIGVPKAPPPSIVRYPPTTYNPAAGEIEYDPAERTTIAAFPDISFSFNGLAIDRGEADDPSDDRLYVAEGSRVRIYSSAEDGNTLVDTITPAGLNSASYAALDAERRLLYVTTCKEGLNKCVVWVLNADAPYTFVKEIDGSQTPAGKFFSNQGLLSIAVDETNSHLFIGDLATRDDIYELDEDYDFVSTFEIPGGALGGGVQSDVAENFENPDPADENPDDNYRYLYVPLSGVSGSAIAFAPPDVGPPEIKNGGAQNIGEGEAELVAEIHPHQLGTTYTLEYVSEAQHAIDEFESAIMAKNGALPAGNAFQRVSTVIDGLTPGESYRLRIFAENEGGEDEEEATFTTYNDADPDAPACSNQALRTGPSAALPDCRAWELVTPPGARGPEGAGLEGERFGMQQSSPSGNALSFELKTGALPGTEATGGFHGDPYLATRSASGWSTQLVGPTGAQASKPKPGSFSPDQGYSFWTAEGVGSAMVGTKQTTYVRYPDGRSELIGRGSIDTDPRALGRLITEGGTHIIFQTLTVGAEKAQKLEPNAPDEGITAVYDRTDDEVTHVVSLLPGDVTPSQDASYAGASADGEGIAFTIGGTLYLRVGNKTTYEIGLNAISAGVSEGGERIFYVKGGDLKAFDVSSEEEIDFTGSEISSAIPVNVAPQGTRAYFVSETAVGGANPNGDTAQAGEQNLYLSEEGAITFVATVTERDVEGVEIKGTGRILDGLGLWTLSVKDRQPAIDPSRLTPDGQVFVFQSRANLEGYQPGEEPQVYLYDSVSGRLDCISCPPTQTPATGGAALQSINSLNTIAPLSPYGFVPALRADGERLFFESTEALVSTDTDDLRDVYEWEEDGVGSCDREGGCVYLISSGQSARPDFLFGHSASGDDVFVSTADVLVPGSAATISIYDARVGGGFAKAPIKNCMYVDECHPSASPPPVLPQPGLPSGNPDPPKIKKCPKGKRKVKRKGKVVCVKKHKKQDKGKKAGAKRGASR